MIKLQDPGYSKILEGSIFTGKTVIVESLEDSIDPAINPLIGRETFLVGNDRYIKLNDVQLEFNKDFKLYLVSDMSNPHFKPDIQSKTRLLNFVITN